MPLSRCYAERPTTECVWAEADFASHCMRRGCFLARQRVHEETWISDSIPSFYVSMYLRTC
jgi:hypothetical protein